MKGIARISPFTLITILICLTIGGCVVTGQLAYTDPQTGATANVGISQNVDAKSIKKLRDLRNK